MDRASGTYGTITKDLVFLSSESWKERKKRVELSGTLRNNG